MKLKRILFLFFISISTFKVYAQVAGQALRFNGVDDYVEMNAVVIPNSGDFTVSVWAKANSTQTGFREILSQHGGSGTHFYLGMASNGNIRAGDHWADTGVSYPLDDQWHFFTLVKTSDNTHLYLDGSLIATRGSSINNPAGNEFRVGTQFGSAAEYFSGEIDEVRIWNIARSETEIQETMQIILNGDEVGLVGYWSFNGNVNDGSGNGNHGTVFGPQFVESDTPIIGFFTITEEHNNNNTSLTVYNNGVVGASTGADVDEGDVGFEYNGVNGLYEGGLVIAQSEEQVSGGLYTREFTPQSFISSIDASPLEGFDQAFEASYTDQYYENAIGVNIVQRTYSKSTTPDDDYIIIDFEIINDSGEMLSDIYVGLAMDWDVGTASNNLGGYDDTDRNLSYVFEADGATNQYYYGIAAISGEVSGHTIWPNGAGDGQLFSKMTTFSELPSTSSDLRSILSVGPFNIPVDEGVNTVFAVLGGLDLANLQSNVDVAMAAAMDATDSSPVVVTDDAMNISDTSATLSGIVNPNGEETDVIFEYGETESYGDTVWADPSVITGTDPVSVTAYLTDLFPETEYHYRVVANNAAGESVGQDRVFSTDSESEEEVPPDVWIVSLAPVLAFTSGNYLVNENQDITVLVEAGDDSNQVTQVLLYYASGSSVTYNSIAMNLVNPSDWYEYGGLYQGSIPGSDITLEGVKFYIQATNSANLVAQSWTNVIKVEFSSGSLSTNITGSTFESGFPADRWRLISVPAKLDNTDIDAVLADELGEYDGDSWSIFYYEPTRQEYFEHAPGMAPGRAFWLYQNVEDGISFSTGSGQSIDLQGFSLHLKPGWNLIGSPYPFPVSLFVDQDQFYGPITYGQDGSEGWSEVVTGLDPWGGYAIYNRSQDIQEIELNPMDNGLALGKQRVSIPTDGWGIRLMAKGANYSDVANYVGRWQGAEEGLDRFDNPEPPYMGKYVSLYMERPDWEIQWPRFSSDIRSPENENGTWDVDLKVKGESGPITLSYEVMGIPNPDLQMVLIDPAERLVYNVLKGEIAVIRSYSETLPYRLKLIAGKPEYVQATVTKEIEQLPREFNLGQNYPNPFNPVTSIHFSLSRQAPVKLSVYNIRGQEVARLVDGWMDVGYHDAVWPGRDRSGREVASGMYFAILSDGHRTLTRKMLLIR